MYNLQNLRSRYLHHSALMMKKNSEEGSHRQTYLDSLARGGNNLLPHWRAINKYEGQTACPRMYNPDPALNPCASADTHLSDLMMGLWERVATILEH